MLHLQVFDSFFRMNWLPDTEYNLMHVLVHFMWHKLICNGGRKPISKVISHGQVLIIFLNRKTTDL